MTDLTPQEREKGLERFADRLRIAGQDIADANVLEIWDAGFDAGYEAAEAHAHRLAGERDRLADRVAELEAHPINLEPGRRTELESRLQRVQEALTNIQGESYLAELDALDEVPDPLTACKNINTLARQALAALAGEDEPDARFPGFRVVAGEDDGPPQPQREGDYL